MQGVCLRFYTNEFQKHDGVLLHEWLIEFARKNGIKGGSAFRAIAGFGRHGVMHEEHFFELASNVPVEINFIISKEEANNFINKIKQNNINIIYSLTDCEYGTTDKNKQN